MFMFGKNNIVCTLLVNVTTFNILFCTHSHPLFVRQKKKKINDENKLIHTLSLLENNKDNIRSVARIF